MKGKSGAAGGGPAVNFQGDDMAWLDEVGRDMSSRRESNLGRGRPNDDVGEDEFGDDVSGDDDDGDFANDYPSSIRLPQQPRSRST